jgi:hypothetical protein
MDGYFLDILLRNKSNPLSLCIMAGSPAVYNPYRCYGHAVESSVKIQPRRLSYIGHNLPVPVSLLKGNDLGYGKGSSS